MQSPPHASADLDEANVAVFVDLQLTVGGAEANFQSVQGMKNGALHLLAHAFLQRGRLHVAGLNVHGGTGGIF